MTAPKLEPIAIVGMSCRFPSADSLDAYWELLINGTDAITEVPPQRWNAEQWYDPDPATAGKTNTRWGGFLDSVYDFDPFFFKIMPAQAARMDPQQRLILEVAWEALENAAIDPTSLSDSQTGVFIGVSHCDHHKVLYDDSSRIDGYNGPNTYYCFTANRLSYLLNLHGPSMAIDTACSSSLVAVHLACQSLRSGESDHALVGGVNINLSPDEFIALSSLRVLSSTGSCQTFDKDADGYVRGEGCGVIVLKRLSDAISNNDNILATIRGSAVNQDGLSNGITAPNGTMQQAVIGQALKNASVRAEQISYVEAQGTATSMGDSIEAIALNKVLMQNRTNELPCWLGSVKTNIGHLEAASGMAGIVKVVLAMGHKEIPQHLHFKEWNQQIASENIRLAIPTESCSWPATNDVRLAGVSAFGFGGTNCHVILEEAPQQSRSTASSENTSFILTLSAKTEPALTAKIAGYIRYLEKNPGTSVADLCYTTNTGRTHFNNRIAIVTNTVSNLAQQLSSLLLEKQSDSRSQSTGRPNIRRQPKIAFFFSAGEGFASENYHELYKTQPVFRNILERCNHAICELEKASILEKIFEKSSRENTKQDDNIVFLFALEYALAKFYQSIGVEPSILIGHQLGEYAAACVADVLSLEDGLKLVIERYENNSIQNDLDAGVRYEQLKSTKNPVDFIKQIEYSNPKYNLFSTHAGEFTLEANENNEFLFNQQGAVELEKTVSKLYEEYIDVIVEIGPKSSSLDKALHRQDEGTALLLWGEYPDLCDRKLVLHHILELYQRGIDIKWSEFDIDCLHQKLQLPTYPFQRRTYCFG